MSRREFWSIVIGFVAFALFVVIFAPHRDQAASPAASVVAAATSTPTLHATATRLPSAPMPTPTPLSPITAADAPPVDTPPPAWCLQTQCQEAKIGLRCPYYEYAVVVDGYGNPTFYTADSPVTADYCAASVPAWAMLNDTTGRDANGDFYPSINSGGAYYPGDNRDDNGVWHPSVGGDTSSGPGTLGSCPIGRDGC